MKKNIIWIFIVIVWVCIASYGFGLFDTKVKVGQAWQYVIYKDDPFKKPIFKRYRVIDVKNGYVLYLNEKNDTLSDSERWFTSGAELIVSEK